MPTHVIAGHLAAVLAPLAALLALAYALVPRTRAGLRLPTLVAAVVAAATCLVAAAGGSALWRQLREVVGADAVRATTSGHAHDGDSLAIAAVVLAVLLLASAWTWLAPGRPRTALAVVAAVLVGVAALATLWLTGTTMAGGIASVWSHHVALQP